MTRKKCDNRAPTIRLNIHSPETGWRKHKDVTTKLTASSDFELIVGTYLELVKLLGYRQTPFVAGFLLDIINRLPDEIRKVIAVGVMQGWGTKVELVEEEGKEVLQVSNVPTYPPLAGNEERENGIVVPHGGRGPSGLVLPGEDK